MGSHSPLTGKKVSTPISLINCSKLIADWNSTFGIDVSNELEGIREIEKYLCPDSGLLFFKPENSCGGSKLYEELGKFPWYYPKEKWEYNKALEKIPLNSKIIEIGCGSGDFLEQAHRKHAEVCGLDINPVAAQIASGKGFRVFCEDIDAFSSKNNSVFDALCAFQLLEHISHPLVFLKCALRLLRPNGLLILATPNAGSFLRYQYTLLDMPPHHMAQWSAQAYKFLETILPVKVEAISYEPLSDSHIPHYSKSTADHLLRKIGIKSSALSKLVERTLRHVGSTGLLSPFVKGQGMLVFIRKTEDTYISTQARRARPSCLRANLGCGNCWHPEWRNFDLVSTNPNVETLDLLAEWGIPYDSFQTVYSSHVLEHLPRSMAPQFLKKCWRVLKTGGIIRLVVPDLESIAINYLNSVQNANIKTGQGLAEHEWMTLELLDQLVRTFSGGFIGRLWASRPLHARSLIVERFGREAQAWIEKFDMSFESGHSPLQPDQVYECTEPVPFKEMEFRRSGEIHRWMYDRVSLEKLLIAAGFSRISVKSATESAIEGFANYCLDTDESGNVRKPDSLFMEAIK